MASSGSWPSVKKILRDVKDQRILISRLLIQKIPGYFRVPVLRCEKRKQM